MDRFLARRLNDRAIFAARQAVFTCCDLLGRGAAAALERAFSLFRLYLGTSPSEKRGGGDEKKVTAAELRFLLTSLGDKLSDDQVDAMVQQAGRRGVAGDIDVAAFVENFAREEWPEK